MASGPNTAAFNIGIALGSAIGGQTAAHWLTGADAVDWRPHCSGGFPADGVSDRPIKPARIAPE